MGFYFFGGFQKELLSFASSVSDPSSGKNAANFGGCGCFGGSAGCGAFVPNTGPNALFTASKTDVRGLLTGAGIVALMDLLFKSALTVFARENIASTRFRARL